MGCEPSLANAAYSDIFADGLFTITVYYLNGRFDQTTAWFGLSGIYDRVIVIETLFDIWRAVTPYAIRDVSDGFDRYAPSGSR